MFEQLEMDNEGIVNAVGEFKRSAFDPDSINPIMIRR